MIEENFTINSQTTILYGSSEPPDFIEVSVEKWKYIMYGAKTAEHKEEMMARRDRRDAHRTKAAETGAPAGFDFAMWDRGAPRYSRLHPRWYRSRYTPEALRQIRSRERNALGELQR